MLSQGLECSLRLEAVDAFVQQRGGDVFRDLGDDGSEQSSTAIRARIRRLIGQEDPARPLSDSQLAALLAEENIKVARRTVAKYREAMQIEPSSERKRRRRLSASSQGSQP